MTWLIENINGSIKIIDNLKQVRAEGTQIEITRKLAETLVELDDLSIEAGSLLDMLDGIGKHTQWAGFDEARNKLFTMNHRIKELTKVNE